MTTPAPVTPPVPGAVTPEPGDETSPQNWEAFLESQTAEIKTLYTGHTEALMNTVKATRKERDDFKAELKKLAKTADEGSELRTQLELMEANLERTERKATFLEEAIKPQIQCKNPRAAFLLAEAETLYDKKGNPDWPAIKEAAPELFGVVSAKANAGNGTEKPVPASQNMNAFIRTAAGRH